MAVDCPVCGATGEGSRDLLFELDAAEVVRMALVEERDPARAAALRGEVERLWGGPRCCFLRCRDCSFEFADPYVAGDERFYELLYEDFHYGGHDWDWDLTRDRLRALLAERGSDGVRLLEVGAGSGSFLRRVVPELLPARQVVCTEFNAAALHGLRAMGVEALAADFRDLEDPKPGRAFTWVCLFHVLEHLDGLDRAFERLGALTTPDAHLFISLPNPRNASFYEERGVYLEWPPHHIGRFTRRAFEVIGARHGWELVAHRVQPVRSGELLRAFAASRFVAASRRPGSLARRVRGIQARRLRLALSVPFVGLALLGALARVPWSAREGLGRSHWVELRRVASPAS